MVTENMLCKDFDCLAQRVIYAYKCKFPDFIPMESDMATCDEQAELNNFFRHVICFIYDHSDLIAPYEPDACLENGVMNKTNPELVTKMKSIEKKLIAFYQLLFDIGRVLKIENGRCTIEKNALKITGGKMKKLNRIGIFAHPEANSVILTNEAYPKCFSAWKLLTTICTVHSERDNKEMLWFRFMNAIFHPSAISELHLYGWLFPKPEYLEALESSLLDLGYTYDYKDGRLRVIKEYPKKQLGYLAIEFSYRRRNQLSIEFHIPDFTNLLEAYEQMDEGLKVFLFDRLKDCDACGYCTQTDKSGRRKALARPFTNNGRTSLKCPLYPHFACHDLERETADHMIQLFTMAEAHAGMCERKK